MAGLAGSQSQTAPRAGSRCSAAAMALGAAGTAASSAADTFTQCWLSEKSGSPNLASSFQKLLASEAGCSTKMRFSVHRASATATADPVLPVPRPCTSTAPS